MALWYLLAAIALVAAGLLLRGRAQARRIERLLGSALTPEERRIVDELVPITRRLPEDLRQRLEGRINRFLDQITFRGHGGVEVNEAMRLSIAAQACLLIVNTEVWYDTLRNVLVYPSAFGTRRASHEGFLVNERSLSMLGESWARGPVVLSWDHALEGGLDDSDGFNVVIHEFAHQLDALTGQANGIPILSRGQDYAGWEKAMLDAYHDHVERLHSGQVTLIDPYGATNHEEFFAEAVVTFFERPRAMKREEPALYAQFEKLLALDPASWR